MDPRALTELFPTGRSQGAPLDTSVTEDRFLVLTPDKSYRIPSWALPRLMDNHGMYIVSLGNVCRWLGQQAEALGVEIYPGFAAAEISGTTRAQCAASRPATWASRRTARTKAIISRAWSSMRSTRCSPKAAVDRCRRSSCRSSTFAMASIRRSYGIGLKELWQVAPGKHRKGLVLHSQGWPLDTNTGGGSFVYHFGDDLVAVGFVVHLNYANPHLSPYDEFQRIKTHPSIRGTFEGGKRLGYGARAINEGGLQSVPKLVFPAAR
jgi:electron-transferring-flavoprotein dehydrogenase